MPATGFSHYNLRAPRALLDELRDFYRDVVGLEAGHRPSFQSFGYWLYAGGQAVLHLSEAGAGENRPAAPAGTFDHAAFRCTGREAYEITLSRRGIAYRVANVPGTGTAQVFFKDPAGNGVELNFEESMGSDEREIRALHADWIAAVNDGALARLLEMLTDDVVFLNPGQEAAGKEKFSANFRAAHERFLIDCSSALEEVVVAGDLAYARSKDRLTIAPHAGGDATHLAGDRMTVYRKGTDGRWRLARDGHTLTPEESGEPRT